MGPKPTTQLLQQLRTLMQNTQYVTEALAAYIIPSNDAHNSEYVADCDKYRAFISGFTGSSGTAIVTKDEALLWTDGRYFLQASQEMDSNWTLMKEGQPGTLTQDAWLRKFLPPSSTVGVDARIYTSAMWNKLQGQLSGHTLVPVKENLVKVLWTHRPARPANPVVPLGLEFTGKTIEDKLKEVRAQMEEKNAHSLVLSALDEIAWFLNLRGNDIQYNPVFFAYVIINKNSVVLFLRKQQVTDDVSQHLKTQAPGEPFQILEYDQIGSYIEDNGVPANRFYWTSEDVSRALSSRIPQAALLSEITPVPLMKAVKNETEIRGMRNAHMKDAVALCCYFSWLEKNVPSGKVTEISGATRLEQFRAQQADFVGPSFPTISSVGPHGAIIHYQPSPETDVPITTDTLYLCDSGAQFRDGTTDVTRTMHFGTPDEEQILANTLVLKGQINLATTVFPSKLKGNHLDSFARKYLWDVGLDYGHGTGHGIGSYLNVHEGPMGISWRPMPDDPGLVAGMFVSNEPGFYADGKWGIRIEDIVEIVPATTTYNFNKIGFLTFDTITLVPKQKKLIKVELLTDKELSYINRYHQQCRDTVGPLLEKQELHEAKEWLWRETEPLIRH